MSTIRYYTNKRKHLFRIRSVKDRRYKSGHKFILEKLMGSSKDINVTNNDNHPWYLMRHGSCIHDVRMGIFFIRNRSYVSANAGGEEDALIPITKQSFILLSTFV